MQENKMKLWSGILSAILSNPQYVNPCTWNDNLFIETFPMDLFTNILYLILEHV